MQRTIELFLLRLFENNHNATASSSVLVVLTLLTFRKREERSRLCSLRVFRCFVFAIYIVNVEGIDDRAKKSLRIVGLNYSLEEKKTERREKEERRISCLHYRFYIAEPYYYCVIHYIYAWELMHSVCNKKKKNEKFNRNFSDTTP
jgi:hypothetical protein